MNILSEDIVAQPCDSDCGACHRCRLAKLDERMQKTLREKERAAAEEQDEESTPQDLSLGIEVAASIGLDAFLIPGQIRPPTPSLPEWHGWPIPTRVALIADAGAGKSTILADVAAWYQQRGKRVLVAAAEAIEEWEERINRYPLEARPWLYDWETDALRGRSPATYTDLPKWDAIIVDPGIAAFQFYNLKEERNGTIRKLMFHHVLPVLAPGGDIWLSWHVGHQNKERGRGQSDLHGWARLAMLYDRQDDATGLLTATKANRHQKAYKALMVRLDDQERPVVQPADHVGRNREQVREARIQAELNYIATNPGTTAKALSEALNIPTRTVQNDLAGLNGEIRREKDGRNVRLYRTNVRTT